MGAGAYLAIQRLKNGELPDDAPYFMVKEPMGIFPLFAHRYGRWVNLEVLCNDNQWVMRNATHVVPLMVSRFPVFGIAILRKVILTVKNQWESGLGVERVMAEGEYKELRDIWAEISPGVWCVTEYYEYGTEQDVHFNYMPKKVEWDKKIQWEIWT